MRTPRAHLPTHPLPRGLAARAALCAALALACAQCGGGSGAPNVILITLDTTRPDYLSAYGGANRTPALDALAAEGVRFDVALSASAVTPVSHATILTGRFPYEHGLRVLSAGSGFRLPESQPTIATVLREAGYATAAIHSAFPVSGYFGLDRDFQHFDSLDGALQVAPGDQKTSWDTQSLQRRSDDTTDRALAFARDADRPFFLWLHYWDPHDPILTPPKAFMSHLTGPTQGAAAQSPTYELVYATEVRFMDQQLGRLFDGLRQAGLYDDTLIAVTADHGEGLADGYRRHGWGKHRMTYQEQLLVPLIVRGPGIAAGAVVRDMVRTVDVLPTLLDYLSLPHDGYSGRSLRALVEGEALPPAVAYADQINGYDFNASMVKARPDAAFLYTVCDGRWKLIFRPHMDGSELFDLARDPGETRNVLADHPDVYLRLMADLAARDPWVLEAFPETGQAQEGVGDILDAIGYGGDGEASDLDWWWTCPAHPEYRRDARESGTGSKRHAEDGCEQAVVPRTSW